MSPAGDTAGATTVAAMSVPVPQSITTVLYDLDGTLVDHERAARAGVDAWCRHLGLPAGQWERWIEIEDRWFTRFERGEISHLGQRIARCREFLDRPDLGEDEALDLYEHYLAAYRDHWCAYPDAVESLQAVRESGRRIGVLTNGAEVMQRAKMERTGLWAPDMLLCATVELGAPKPQPEAYLGALTALGARPEETLMIGDSLANDVRGARAVGMEAVHLVREGRASASGETVIRALSDLRWE